MSKKYKRQVRKETPSITPAAKPAGATSRAQSSLPTVFDPDYTYIIKDLRRIGIIAGSYIAILVILSFILK